MRLASSPFSLGTFAALALGLSACADPIAPAMDAGALRPTAAVGTDPSPGTLRETFGSGVETSGNRDTRVEVCDGMTCIDAYVLSTNPRWAPPIAGTSWIGPAADADDFYSIPTEVDVYQATFTLPDNFVDPVINLSLYADNAATIYVNGVQVGQQMQGDFFQNYGCTTDACTAWTDPFDYTTTGNAVAIPWMAGENTLRIEVLNAEFEEGCQNVEVVTPECASASGLDFLAKVYYELRGDQGCSLGFWKQPAVRRGLWAPTGYTQGQSVGSVFASAPGSVSGKTLLEGLNLGGGQANALTRQAVAALLNAASPSVDYPLTTAQVIANVNAAYASSNWAYAEVLDGYNNLHNSPICPD